MIRAGYGFDGAPSTGTPPAHSIAARMSESEPPHLPSARTGRIQPFQPSPAMPRELFASAPMIPATRVPCQELSPCWQEPNTPLDASAAVTQSPGSEGSGSQPSPSFALPESRMKSKPGSSLPPSLARSRSG